MNKSKKKYEVEIDGKWVRCSSAIAYDNGWLDFKMEDGTIGLKRPGTWREVKPIIWKGVLK